MKWVNPDLTVISRPGQSQGLLYKHLQDSLIQSVSQSFPPTALQRRHAQTVRDSSFSYNPEGHHNPISGSKVMAIY